MFLYSLFIDNWFNPLGFMTDPLWSEHVLLTSGLSSDTEKAFGGLTGCDELENA